MFRLLYKKNYLTFLLLVLLVLYGGKVHCQNEMRIVFWNVENLFDIWNDSVTLDDDFTPNGQYHWNNKRYRTKLSHICQTIVALGDRGKGRLHMPLLVGMAEVENDKVLRDLCRGTPLRRYGYDFIHFDSPDRRGIDNALLYQRNHFTPYHAVPLSLSDSACGYFTRDILLVEGVTKTNDTIIVLVNHFPSKRGGTSADRHRMQAARRLRSLLDSLAVAHPRAALVAMGDFNSGPDEVEIRNGLMRKNASSLPLFVNLMEAVPHGEGSYKYQDFWSCLDQFIVSAALLDGGLPLQLLHPVGQIFSAPFVMVDDTKYLDKKVFRTFLGFRYQGGYSDHLPIYIDLKHP